MKPLSNEQVPIWNSQSISGSASCPKNTANSTVPMDMTSPPWSLLRPCLSSFRSQQNWPRRSWARPWESAAPRFPSGRREARRRQSGWKKYAVSCRRQ